MIASDNELIALFKNTYWPIEGDADGQCASILREMARFLYHTSYHRPYSMMVVRAGFISTLRIVYNQQSQEIDDYIAEMYSLSFGRIFRHAVTTLNRRDTEQQEV